MESPKTLLWPYIESIELLRILGLYGRSSLVVMNSDAGTISATGERTCTPVACGHPIPMTSNL